jgi:hypothetical protein
MDGKAARTRFWRETIEVKSTNQRLKLMGLDRY